MKILNTFFKNLFSALLILMLLSLVFSFFTGSKTQSPEKISLSELARKIQLEEVAKIKVSDDTLLITDKQGKEFNSEKEKEASLTETLANYGIQPKEIAKVEIEMSSNIFGGLFWLSILVQVVLPFLLIFGIFWYMSRQAQKGMSQNFSFSRANIRLFANPKEKINFKDVAGLKEAKEELREVVDFLKNPQKFLDVGARIPRGVLLMGSPGTGKTLLARAVAGEAQAPFFHISGSEFVELFVGVGASRVRDLFNTAKKASPSIIFIDEIDAVGRQRGSGLGGGHDEREQTLNQILVEMDGFDRETNIIVIAATNRPDVLDPALLRPGRFDRRVILDLPDVKEREEILQIHMANKKSGQNINIKRIAERTPGFSGADLANLVNEAAIWAARKNRKEIFHEDMMEAMEKVILGPERKSHILTQKEKEITAFHEAGHALLAGFLPNTDSVHKISIVSRGRAAGYTLKLPVEDTHLYSQKHLLDELAVMLGGYAAEKIVFKDLTTGASNDLKEVSEQARKLVMHYGMSEKIGPQSFGRSDELVFLGRDLVMEKNYSEKVAEEIDGEVKRLINDAFVKAKKIILRKRKFLDKLAKRLIEKETVEKEEFEEMMRKEKKRTTRQ
ncbi:MAG: ATP-dependent zinc metalloprotease FtsH [Parcubacteria group bacterium GW2011_GWC1_45_9]|nr:MAG: ATP-dependent zinc metalloprotease FtsH [Parcubacteria group bacterium GW2011_GWA1_Parcubacteria_45_10]KKT88814.1 MAG: ATP-dependent zinc metalloprotease FtsH [Parcubacteria group bacterium GW2011_GWB1_45_10]KKU16962.1 MAG: ATP-dependent zinc metalloprotease FtsH [Parcubacteria group bacterium GW2011_GWC1_45_9]